MRTEDELRENEGRFRTYVEQTPLALFVADRHGRCVDFNPAALKMLGYDAATLAGVQIFDITPEEEHRAVLRDFAALTVGRDIEGEYRLRKRDGNLIWVSLHATMITDAHFMAFCHDITARKRAEEYLRRISDRLLLATRTANVGIWDLDVDNNRLSWDDTMYRLYGIMPEIGAYEAWQASVHPKDLPRADEEVQMALHGEKEFDTDFRVMWPDRTVRHIKATGLVQRDASGRAVRMLGTNWDITELKNAEEALRESEARYRSLFKNMLEGLAYCRMLYEDDRPQDFIYLNVNEQFEQLTGLRDVVGKRASEVIPGVQQSNPQLFEIYGRVASTGEPERFETYVEPLDEWFSISVYSPEMGSFVAVFDVINQRKRAEEAREATIELLDICNRAGSSRELMRELLCFFQQSTGCEAVGMRLREGADFPYYETRGFPDDFVLAENSVCATDPAGEMVRDGTGHPALDCMCGNILCGRFDPTRPFFTAHGSFWSNCTTELLASTTEAERLARTRNRCNGEGYESVALIPLRTQDTTFGLIQFNDKRKGRFTAEKIALMENLVSYVAIALAKLRSDEALRESSLFNQQIIDCIGEGVIVHGRDLRYQLWNPFMTELSGLPADEVLGGHPWELFPCLVESGVVDRLEKALVGQASPPADITYHFPRTGRSGWFADSYAPLRNSNGEIIGIISTLRDITERRMAEEEREKLKGQLFQAQKMEAIGLLAGGVAHDFNNVLQVITSFASLLEKTLEGDKPRDYVNGILASAARAAGLTRGLLAYSRKQTLELAPTDINDVVKSVHALLARIIGEDIELTLELSPGEPVAVVDANQLQQVLINLAANARDAMPCGGRLTIATDFEEIGRPFIEACGYGNTGLHVCFTVSDTGSGMDEETRAKIFEPFFTTKEVGKGTGLGLAIVHGIVAQHNGFIRCQSEEGRGTSFTVYLPAVAPAGKLPEETRTCGPAGGSETILLAEDDQQVMEITKLILETEGYRVLAAMDGDEAVEQYREHREQIALVILDAVMPKKNGKEAYDEIRRLNPAAKICFMSGYSYDILQDRTAMGCDVTVIAKPILPDNLLKAIRALLDG